jgi:hypothetical protein
MSIKVVNAGGSFENLYDGSFASNFEDLAFSDGAITETYIDNFCVLGEFDIIENDKRTIDFDDSSVVDSGSDIVVSSNSLDVCAEEVCLLHEVWIFYTINICRFNKSKFILLFICSEFVCYQLFVSSFINFTINSFLFINPYLNLIF